MHSKTYTVISIIAFFLLNAQQNNGQTFKKSLLINLPGNNSEIDLATFDYLPATTYISWVNKLDSTYTIYLKQLSPIVGENIIVASDKTVKTNPQVQFIHYDKGIRIAWQSQNDSIWRVMTRDYYESSFNDVSVMIDSLDDDPQISLSSSSIAWVNNGNFFLKEFDQDKVIKLDSNYCSKPYIRGDILYEKIDNNGLNIYRARLKRYPEEYWEIARISNGAINSNPSTGMEGGGFTYESFIDGNWRITYGGDSRLETTNNINCNYKNPVYFTYPIPTSSAQQKTPFFIAFDSDSIAGNKEVMIKTLYYGLYDSLINVSDNEGDDYSPHLAYLTNEDTVFVSIIWEHRFNDKVDVWMAKTIFNPIIGSVKNDNKTNGTFFLRQNYPNPFNPATTISYEIPIASHVKLKVYDMLGREVATLADEYKQPGNYKSIFSIQNSAFSSGIYFYSLKVRDSSPGKPGSEFREVKKMLLLK